VPPGRGRGGGQRLDAALLETLAARGLALGGGRGLRGRHRGHHRIGVGMRGLGGRRDLQRLERELGLHG
jgi:hypothetical protein